MAIWQYTFHTLLKESVQALSPNYSFEKDEEGFDDKRFWQFKFINKDFFNEIDSILSKDRSWSTQIDLYGNQESNCFEVLFDNNYVISASFKIDFTSNYDPVLNEIVEFCLLKGLIILDENLDIVPLNVEIIKSIINSSSQVKNYNKLL